MATLILVLDTNIIMASFFPSKNSPSYEIITRWKNEEFVMLHSQDILSEYIEKLLSFGIEEANIKTFVKTLFILGKETEIKFFHLEKYPINPDDIPFLLCALNGNATHLVSYDQHLLDLDGVYDMKICKPLPFLKELRKATHL